MADEQTQDTTQDIQPDETSTVEIDMSPEQIEENASTAEFNESFLIEISKLKQPLTAAPTYNPKNFFEQFAHYNGALYVNINNSWLQIGAGTQASCRIYRGSTDQTVGSGSWTTIQFNAESYDTNSDFDSSTNYTFTAPRDGLYLFHLNVQLTAAASGDIYQVGLLKNSDANEYSKTQYVTEDTNSANYTHTDTLSLSANDTVKFRVNQASGGNININNGQNISYATVIEL